MREQGYNITDISQALNVDRKTVRKYIDMKDFTPSPPTKSEKPSILDKYKPTIDLYIAQDKKSWHKQTHTAKRIYDRLCDEEGFTGSYSVVQRYVKKLRAEMKDNFNNTQARQELIWEPGCAQVDFGEADFIVAGETQRLKYLTVSFPYSNNGFVQVFYGENAECVCQGLKDIFNHIGFVPPRLVFDNATGVGHRVGDKVRETELFQRFQAHYRIAVSFCNPYSGYEKGNVERKVAYVRRNLFVPTPKIENIENYNKSLLESMKFKEDMLHYKKEQPISDLFKDDLAAMRQLPEKEFDVCRYDTVKADGYGKICIDGKHYYSTHPNYAKTNLIVAIRAFTINIMKDDGTNIAQHRRQYSQQRTDTVDLETTMHLLQRNPGSWKNSMIRANSPAELRDYMDNCSKHDLKMALDAMNELTHKFNLATALDAISRSIRDNELNVYAAHIIAERINGFGLDTVPDSGPDLTIYDNLLLAGRDDDNVDQPA